MSLLSSSLEMNSIIVTNGYLEDEENPLWKTLDGEYVDLGEKRHGHPCYHRVGDDGKTKTDGVIYFSKRHGRWKIFCQTDFGGWNLSQKSEDPSRPYPPLGQWQLQEGGNDYPRKNGYKAVFEQVIFSFLFFLFSFENLLFKRTFLFLLQGRWCFNQTSKTTMKNESPKISQTDQTRSQPLGPLLSSNKRITFSFVSIPKDLTSFTHVF